MNRSHLLSSGLFVALSLLACTEAPAPLPETPTPVVQGTQLRFPAKHPQLNLLTVSPAEASKAMVVEMPARLVWNEARTQRIYPAFAGRIASIRADVGQSVKSGEVLATLASPDFGVAQADTAKAAADVRLTQKNLARQKELFEAGIIARKDYEQSQAEAERALAESARAEARTKLYGSAAGAGVNQQLQLTAGISGMVVERNLNPGQELRPDQSGVGVPALFVISDPTQLWVQIDARETEVGSLQKGASFELVVASLGGRVFQGKVIAASDAIDPSSRTIKIRGVVDNPERALKSEMLASARVQRSLGAGVLIPAQAALLRGAKHSVFVQTAAGVFEQRDIEIGHQGPKEILVTRGLAVGDQVVSENALLLARQMRIAQENLKAPPAEKTNAAAQSEANKP